MKKKIFFIPIIIAVVIFVYLITTKDEPKRELIEDIKKVNIKKFKAKDIILKYESFGTIYPSVDLKVVSSVSADILYKHNNLSNGKFITKGEILIKLDSSLYELELKKLDADILNFEAKILELQQKEINTKILLKIENSKLKRYQDNLTRYTITKKYIADSQLAKEEIIVLSQEKIVESLKSTLRLIPLNIKSLNSRIKTLKFQKNILDISIEDCTVSMPFDGIVYDIQIEKNQYISQNQLLFKAYDPLKMQVDIDISPEFLKNLGTIENLKAKAFAKSQNRYFDITFSRVSEGLDTQTRMIKLIFNIKQDVLKGTFLNIEIFGKKLYNRFEIPKNIYHNGFIYISKDNKLQFKKVNIEYEQKQSYIISDITQNDKIIISNIKPAIEGIKLESILIGVSDD